MTQIRKKLDPSRTQTLQASLRAQIANLPKNFIVTSKLARSPTLITTQNHTAIMAAALNKIAATSPSRQRPSELETSIANALYDLESNIPDMKTALRPLQFVSAREASFLN